MAFDAQNYSDVAQHAYTPGDDTIPGIGLNELIAKVREHSETVRANSKSYRSQLGELKESKFVNAMRDLQNSIIN